MCVYIASLLPAVPSVCECVCARVASLLPVPYRTSPVIHVCAVLFPRLRPFQSYRNTVPVPRHWCQKRKYLQGKRGIEKTPFELPEFIAMTGIDKIRAAIEEADSLKKVCVCGVCAFAWLYCMLLVCTVCTSVVKVFLFTSPARDSERNSDTRGAGDVF